MKHSSINHTIRLSRFSQNFNPQISKTLQLAYNKQNSQKNVNISSNFIESLATSKHSIIQNEKLASKDNQNVQDSIKQKQQIQTQIDGQQIDRRIYDSQEINKFRRSLLQLPNLYDKTRKIKCQHICPEFIYFLFQILKHQKFIAKLFHSYVPSDVLINQFIGILHGFQVKSFNAGFQIQIDKEKQAFYILTEGAVQKSTVKQAVRQSRKSLRQNSSQTSIVRRSKMKNKTINQKSKIVCFDDYSPILINDNDCSICSLKTMGLCSFILLQKNVWNKFLMTLQKIQQKHLLNFIKHCTTVNLSIYTQKNKHDQKNKQLDQRKLFLYDFKKSKNSESDNDSEENNCYTGNSVKKTTIYGNNLSSSYKLINLLKDQKMALNNEDVYLIVKGSVFLSTPNYIMTINDGSIINSSILLDLEVKQVHIKTLTDTLMAKLVLAQIYFRKQDEIQFIQKIKEIQTFRNQIYGKIKIQRHKEKTIVKQISKLKKDYNQNQLNQLQFSKQFKKEKSKFQPKQLRIKQLSLNKGNKMKINKKKKQRITSKNKTVVENSISPHQEKQNQLARQVAIKYANNYCIFQKIVESQQRVIEKYNLNRVNKLFPIQALLKNIIFKKNLQKGRQNSKKSESKKVNFFKIDEQLNRINKYKQKNSFNIGQKMSVKSSKSSKKSAKDLKSLQKRRKRFQKIKLQKKKKQKAKIIDNLFQTNKIMEKSNQILQKNSFNSKQFRDKNSSLDFHKQRIRQIVNKNQRMKLKQLQSERNYVDFRLTQQQSLVEQNKKELKKQSIYNRKLLVTEPSDKDIAFNQSFISGKNKDFNFQHAKQFGKQNLNNSLSFQNVVSPRFANMKRKLTKRVMTTMLVGRIRQSKCSQDY